MIKRKLKDRLCIRIMKHKNIWKSSCLYVYSKEQIQALQRDDFGGRREVCSAGGLSCHGQELLLPAQRGDQEVRGVPASHLEHFNDWSRVNICEDKHCLPAEQQCLLYESRIVLAYVGSKYPCRYFTGIAASLNIYAIKNQDDCWHKPVIAAAL